MWIKGSIRIKSVLMCQDALEDTGDHYGHGYHTESWPRASALRRKKMSWMSTEHNCKREMWRISESNSHHRKKWQAQNGFHTTKIITKICFWKPRWVLQHSRSLTPVVIPGGRGCVRTSWTLLSCGCWLNVSWSYRTDVGPDLRLGLWGNVISMLTSQESPLEAPQQVKASLQKLERWQKDSATWYKPGTITQGTPPLIKMRVLRSQYVPINRDRDEKPQESQGFDSGP